MTVESAYTFLNAVEPIFGAYFDGVLALRRLAASLEGRRGQLPGDRSANDVLAYQALDESGTHHLVHHVPWEVFLRRNERGGKNHQILGIMAVTTVFTLWDTSHRRNIAAELGLGTSNDLEVPVMGDLRLIRNTLLHRDGIAGVQCANLEMLRWCIPGEPVIITEARIIEMSEAVRSFVHRADEYRSTEHPDRMA